MPDLPGSLAAALADRYTVERELGHGGHATVYLAHDRKHDRKVAIKILAPELALAVRTERFLREIQITGRLTHPHILPAYDSGRAGDVLYYVMPYVPGESLRDRLRREPQLPLDDALRIARDIAAALSHAHRQGVVHRDIKPENILLSDGGALVADFGIARAVTAAGDQGVTQSGVSVGTPPYMSPEQGGATGAVDERSDVYSLACVLYEMLAGHPPFVGATAQELLARHAVDPVPSLRAARSDVPEAVERAITRALAKQPVGRFPTAAAFAQALADQSGGAHPRRRRMLLHVAGGVAVLAGGSVVAARSFLGRADAVTTQSVVVLPCVNLTGDTANEYFSDGITEELINALVQIHGLRVPARTSSFAFKGRTTVDLRDIGRQLNVAHVLECSVRREGDSVRVTAQLVKVADGYHLWSDTYNRALKGVLALQEDLARGIVDALEVRLGRAEAAALARRYTDNPEAYDLYLRGRHFWNRRTPADITKAIDYFRRAIESDSGYALAYSGLADAHVLAGFYSYSTRFQAYREAKASALRAVALDESLAEAHTSLARVYQNVDWDWRGAEREYRRAIALNPRYALARTWYGMFLGRGLARHDEAIRQATAGVALDPLSPWANSNLSVVMNHARRHDEAIEYARRAVELAPDWATAHALLAQGYRWKGMLEAALAEYEIAARLGRGDAGAGLGAIYALTGRRAEALAVLERLQERSTREDVWEQLAILHVALGRLDPALQALDSAVTRHGFRGEPTLASSPHWDPLRSDPRFARLLARVGLPPR